MLIGNEISAIQTDDKEREHEKEEKEEQGLVSRDDYLFLVSEWTGLSLLPLIASPPLLSENGAL